MKNIICFSAKGIVFSLNNLNTATEAFRNTYICKSYMSPSYRIPPY